MSFETHLLQRLRQTPPRRLLTEDEAAHVLVRDYLAANPDCCLCQLPELADMAIARLDDTADKRTAFERIARLKRHAPRVLVIVPPDGLLTFADFLALGMQRLDEADGHTLYAFDLHTYKPAPDWLNAKYWAHPERWEP